MKRVYTFFLACLQMQYTHSYPFFFPVTMVEPNISYILRIVTTHRLTSSLLAMSTRLVSLSVAVKPLADQFLAKTMLSEVQNKRGKTVQRSERDNSCWETEARRFYACAKLSLGLMGIDGVNEMKLQVLKCECLPLPPLLVLLIIWQLRTQASRLFYYANCMHPGLLAVNNWNPKIANK